VRRYLNRSSHGTVVAYVALFVALGGTAVATTQGFILGGTNRVDASPTSRRMAPRTRSPTRC
jgi:hypothetical protein